MKRKYTILALVAFAIASVACSKTELSNKAHKLTGSTKGTYQKPGAPVELTHTTTKVEVDVESSIALIFSTQAYNQEAISIKIKADEGLQLHNLSTPFTINVQEEKREYPLSFTASSNTAGLYYINVFASMQVGSERMNRTFSVPVQIGNGEQKLKSLGSVSRDENNQRIISMPAQETNIRP